MLLLTTSVIKQTPKLTLATIIVLGTTRTLGGIQMGLIGLDNVGSGYSRKSDMQHRVHHHEHGHKDHAKDHDNHAQQPENEVRDQGESPPPER